MVATSMQQVSGLSSLLGSMSSHWVHYFTLPLLIILTIHWNLILFCILFFEVKWQKDCDITDARREQAVIEEQDSDKQDRDKQEDDDSGKEENLSLVDDNGIEDSDKDSIEGHTIPSERVTLASGGIADQGAEDSDIAAATAIMPTPKKKTSASNSKSASLKGRGSTASSKKSCNSCWCQVPCWELYH